MSISKICPTIIVKNIENSVLFYTKEIALFSKEIDFGMGDIRLISEDKLFGIFLHEDENHHPSNHPLLTILTKTIDEEYARIKNINFTSGGGFLPKNGIFEYPAGRNFMIIDPSGNKIIIEQE